MDCKTAKTAIINMTKDLKENVNIIKRNIYI